uniref:Putative secreted protein n=1 Tax=Anopheles darlingi TaxID=43151 RepID=A0A2M4DDZ8_ANODA
MFLSGEWLRGRTFLTSAIFLPPPGAVGLPLPVFRVAANLVGRNRLRFMFSTRSRRLTRPPIEKLGFSGPTTATGGGWFSFFTPHTPGELVRSGIFGVHLVPGSSECRCTSSFCSAPLKSMLRYQVLVRSLRGLGLCSADRRCTLVGTIGAGSGSSNVSLINGRLTGPLPPSPSSSSPLINSPADRASSSWSLSSSLNRGTMGWERWGVRSLTSGEGT